jgi:hypothetical protein
LVKIGIGNNFFESKFVLAPRGRGRNTFRMLEILQLGLIPVYVYDDICWLPYYDSINWSSFSIIIQSDQLESGLNHLNEISDEKVIGMRSKVRSLYHSHFTKAGAMEQLLRFFKLDFTGTDLRCKISH